MGGFINIGFGNLINADRVLAIVNPDSAPSKRLIQKAKEEELLIDATQGRRTKSIIISDQGRIILSALQPDTLSGRSRSSEDRVQPDIRTEP